MAVPQVEIAVSNMDLYPIDLPGRASWRSHTDRLESYLDETEFVDFEINPTTATFADMHQNNLEGESAERISRVVGSLHQTFYENNDLIGKSCKVGGVYKSGESYQRMLEMQAGRDQMPIVVYPGNRLANDVTKYGVPEKSPLVVQPSAEIYRDFGVRPEGVRSNGILLARMGELMISGLCPDTVHARRRAADGSKTPLIEDVWADQFASGKVYQMHVAADRLDMLGRDEELARKSHHEFQAFQTSWAAAKRTEMGSMIIEAVNNWRKPDDLGRNVLRMVLEIPPIPREYRRRKAQHLAFADSLAQVIEYAGGKPLFRSSSRPQPQQ